MRRHRLGSGRFSVLATGIAIALVGLAACSSDEPTDSAAGDSDTPPSTSVTARDDTSAPPVTGPTSTTTPPPLGGINATALESSYGPGVVMVISRPCDGQGYSQGTGFAIDDRHIITNWHVVAQDYDAKERSPIDPHPWIMTYRRGWRRGTVIGARTNPDVAVIELDEGEPDMKTHLTWAKTPPKPGQFLAILGFPGLESGEFNLVVGKAEDVDGTTHDVDSFAITRELSGRTGPGNSGGPIVDADGGVVGVHTWGAFDRSHWFGEDGEVVKATAERIRSAPEAPQTECPADGPGRWELSWVVRLGTFSNADESAARRELLSPATPEGSEIAELSSNDWVPFLLSDYPFVLLGGPFASKAAADDAVGAYQAQIDASDQSDRFSAAVFPRSAFSTEATDPPDECLQTSAELVVVHGVTPADPLKLREGPSLDADVVGELLNGDNLITSTDDPVVADDITWIPVSTLDNVCGWVARQYTEPADG